MGYASQIAFDIIISPAPCKIVESRKDLWLFSVKCEMAIFYLVNCDFHSRHEPWFSKIFPFIIPLLRHFTILGQKNAQNMPRYYTVEQGKNTDWKRSDKMAEQTSFY